MTLKDIEIHPFDRMNATPAEYAALNRHTNAIRKEQLPDDPPVPLEESIQNLQTIPDYVTLHLWAAWTAGRQALVGLGDVTFLQMEANQHLAQFDIAVTADYRRQGLGRQFLRLIAAETQQAQRRLLLTGTVDRLPGGEAFMQRIGAHKGLETHVNQLRLEELDRGRLAAWLQRGQARAAEFELGLWEGPYPEEQLAAVVEIHELTNQQPFGELEIEPMHMTPEQIRQGEKNLFARGYQRWTFYLTDRATGKFAGYTETVWNPSRPEVLQQDMTGVFPQYRGRGLGRWLKAAMLAKVLAERPQVKFVRTGNADSNAAMLKINTELGFKPYTANALWQVELEKVLEYLK